jgi:Ca2+-binding EF-hand superfamily protein
VFDNERKGAISMDIIGTILELLGHEVNEDELDEILDEYDEASITITENAITLQSYSLTS